MSLSSNDKVKYTNNSGIEILEGASINNQELENVSWKFNSTHGSKNTILEFREIYPFDNIVAEDENDKLINRYFVMRPRKIQKFLNKFVAIQKWEGYVETVSGDSICSRISDLTNPDDKHERAEFSFDDINEYDHDLVKPGAIFYWSIGHEEVNGTRKRASYIQFRRLPPLSTEEISQIAQQANEIGKELKWE